MTKYQAEQIAEFLNGDAYRDEERTDDEDGWLVLFERRGGRLVVLSGDAVDEFADREAFEQSHCYATISLRDEPT